MTWKKDAEYFQRAIALAEAALAAGNDGFGCVLVDPEGDIIMEQGNAVAEQHDPTAHDALTLVRRAAQAYERDFLSRCTLYATMEPCVMCLGGAMWAGLDHIRYAVSEEELNSLLGGGTELHSAEFARRSHWHSADIQGPYPEVHDQAIVAIQAWVDRILGKVQ